MNKVYRETNLDAIRSPDGLLKFLTEVSIGERPLYFKSLKPVKEKHSTKIVGVDFEKRIFDSKRDALILVYHPLAEKNRGLKEKFEYLAKTNEDDKLIVGRYNGMNES